MLLCACRSHCHGICMHWCFPEDLLTWGVCNTYTEVVSGQLCISCWLILNPAWLRFRAAARSVAFKNFWLDWLQIALNSAKMSHCKEESGRSVMWSWCPGRLEWQTFCSHCWDQASLKEGTTWVAGSRRALGVGSCWATAPNPNQTFSKGYGVFALAALLLGATGVLSSWHSWVKCKCWHSRS